MPTAKEKIVRIERIIQHVKDVGPIPYGKLVAWIERTFGSMTRTAKGDLEIIELDDTFVIDDSIVFTSEQYAKRNIENDIKKDVEKELQNYRRVETIKGLLKAGLSKEVQAKLRKELKEREEKA